MVAQDSVSACKEEKIRPMSVLPFEIRSHNSNLGRPSVLTQINNAGPQDLALEHSTTLFKHPTERSRSLNRARDPGLSLPTSPTEGLEDGSSSTGFKVGVVIHRAESGFAIRVNTIPNFLEINRQVWTPEILLSSMLLMRLIH